MGRTLFLMRDFILERSEKPHMKTNVLRLTKFSCTFATALLAVTAVAQTPATAVPQMLADVTVPATIGATTDAASLPDAPSTSHAAPARAFVLEADPNTPHRDVAPKYAKYIAADEKAQPIDAHDKVIIGLRDLYSPLNFVAMIASSGYEQVVNGAPNYGTDRGAFGERLGAAGIRETSQGFFTDSVFSPMLHMDPRYYVEGPQYGFLHRTVYAATRVLVSKTDSGRHTINSPMLLGYAASTALSTAYYPQINRNFKDQASNYGGSLGGAAVGFLFSEFSDSLLHFVHMKK
jgi:hypothetical protein